MTVKVVEQVSVPRGPVNLDRVVVTDHYVGVFDGATPKGPDVAGVLQATVDVVDNLVAALLSAPPALGAADLVARLTDAVGAAGRGGRASGAVFSLARRQIVVVGDMWVAVDGDARLFAHSTERAFAEVRAAFTELALAHGASVCDVRRDDPGRAAILPLLEREAEFANVDAPGPWFFGTFDGRPVPERHVHVVPVPAGAREVVLASDGFPALGSSLAESEAMLAGVVEWDPLLVGFHRGTKATLPGTTGFDDRSYIRLYV